MFQGAGTPGDAARGLVVVARLRTEYQVGFPGTHDAPRDPIAPLPRDSERTATGSGDPGVGLFGRRGIWRREIEMTRILAEADVQALADMPLALEAVTIAFGSLGAGMCRSARGCGRKKSIEKSVWNTSA